MKKSDSLEIDPTDIEYEPTPYDSHDFRVASPDPDWEWGKPEEERKEFKKAMENVNEIRREVAEKNAAKASGGARPKLKSSSSISGNPPVDVETAIKRQQFAKRRDSSVATMMLVEPISDEEMRRRFRNYEI